MKSLQENPPVLTVHRNGGQYIIRVDDLSYRDLVVGLSKLLPEAESLVLVTPTSVKVFTLDGQETPRRAVEEVSEPDTPDPMEEAMRIAQEEEHEVPGEPDKTVVRETPQGTKVVRRKKVETIAGHEQACGRCGGTGNIQILLDGGVADTTGCPLCSGKGTIRRYGAKR